MGVEGGARVCPPYVFPSLPLFKVIDDAKGHLTRFGLAGSCYRLVSRLNWTLRDFFESAGWLLAPVCSKCLRSSVVNLA